MSFGDGTKVGTGVVYSESTRESVVDDLWREGWFLKTAKGIARHYPSIDADDLAAQSVFTAMRAAESWRDEGGSVQQWVKFRTRGAMLSDIKQQLREHGRMSKYSLDYELCEDGPTLGDVVTPVVSAEDQAQLIDWDDVAVEIREVVMGLTPKQRKFVEARFLQGLSQREEGYVKCGPGGETWKGARKKLKVQLSHLKWLVRP